MDTVESVDTSKGFEVKFAKLISYLFHPLLMPTYGFMLLFFTSNYISTFTVIRLQVVIIGITFLFTFILPSINAYILLKMGKIKSLEMESTSERFMPYLGAAIYFFALFYLFQNASFPNVFQILILGAAISIVMTLVINLKWKISAHMIGIGGIAGAVLGIIYRLHIDLHIILMLVIFVSGWVAYARLKLNAHTPTQVYTGFILGFLVELLLMMYYN